MTRTNIHAMLTAAVLSSSIGASPARAQHANPDSPQAIGQPETLEPPTSAWNAAVGGSFDLNKLNQQINARVDSGAGWESLPTMRPRPDAGLYLSADSALAVDVNSHAHPRDAEHRDDLREHVRTPTVNADALAVLGPGTLRKDAYDIWGFGIPINLHYTQEFGRLHPKESTTQISGGMGGGLTWVQVSDARTPNADGSGRSPWDPTIAETNRLVLLGGAWAGAATAAPDIRIDETIFITVPIVIARYRPLASGFDFRGILRGLPGTHAFRYSDAELTVRYGWGTPPGTQPAGQQMTAQQQTSTFSPFVQWNVRVATARIPDIREETYTATMLSFGVSWSSFTMAAAPPRVDTGEIR